MIVPLSRRAFLAGATAGLATGSRAAGQPAQAPGPGDFHPLRAKPMSGPAAAASVWAYEGLVPGPLLRIRQGDELRVRLANELPEATALHWHGLRLPNAVDGVPGLSQPAVAAGTAVECRFTPPDAGTFWYHATSTLPGQLERGLYGPLIVDEATPIDIDRDVMTWLDGRSRPPDIVPVKTNERLRWRLINPLRGRMMSVRFDRHIARVMAIDGQPAEPFLAHDSRVTLGPGNRIDVFVDAVLEPGTTASILLDRSGSDTEIARLVYDAAEKRRASPLPDPRPLPGNPLPARIDMRNALRVDAPLYSNDSQKRVWLAAASPSDFGRPLFSAKMARTVVLAFPNQGDDAYSVHLHGHHVRLLDNLDDGWKPFWLDTILAGPRRTTRVAFVANNPGKWLIHAQPIDRDPGMVAWFEVT